MKSYDGQKMLEQPAPRAKAVTKPDSQAQRAGKVIGMSLGFGLAVSLEASLVWVILTFLIGATPGFGQVFGACLLFEYALGRFTMKEKS